MAQLRNGALVAIFVAMATVAYTLPDSHDSQPAFDPESLNATYRRAIDRVRPGIVTIVAMTGHRSTPEWSQHEQSKRLKQTSPNAVQNELPNDMLRDATGSGVILDDQGHVLTCSHVVDAADTVFVYLDNGRRLESETIFADPQADIAVIQLSESTKCSPATMGDSDKLHAGDWVVSIGNPYGLGVSMSAGIVSATRRELPNAPKTRLIQTDAATNPGNSGGALIDLEGRVVGITEGGYGVSEGFQGIGFAIPINEARRIAAQLIEKGTIERAYFGCYTQSISGKVRRHLGLTSRGGVIVTDVVPESAAARAGIRVGDIFTHIAGKPVDDAFRLGDAMRDLSPGDELTLTAVRAGKTSTLSIPLGAMPAPANANPEPDVANREPVGGYRSDELGLVIDDAAEDLRRSLGFAASTSGALVTHVMPGTSASKEGVCAGMLILKIGDNTVGNVADFQREMRSHSLAEGILVLIGTPQGNRFVVLQKH